MAATVSSDQKRNELLQNRKRKDLLSPQNGPTLIIMTSNIEGLSEEKRTHSLRLLQPILLRHPVSSGDKQRQRQQLPYHSWHETNGRNTLQAVWQRYLYKDHTGSFFCKKRQQIHGNHHR